MGDERTPLNSLCWYSIPSDPRKPWVRHYIGPPVHGAITPCGVADVNGDGHLDIIRADTWFENKDGKGLEWVAHQNIPMGRKGPFGVCQPNPGCRCPGVADAGGDSGREPALSKVD